jgi:hypothetical protein
MDALLSFPGQSDTPDTPESGITHLGVAAGICIAVLIAALAVSIGFVIRRPAPGR